MLFQNVSIASLAHIDAPRTLSSAEINERLRPTLDRLGIRADVLGDIAGIHSRRFWEDGTESSDAATLAAEKALAELDVPREKIGLLINTSVSRDYLEPVGRVPELRCGQCLPGLPQRHGYRQPHDRAR